MTEPFVMVEVRLHSHPKWLGLSHAARGLWIDALLYAKTQGNGGVLPAAYARFATATESAEEAWIEELVSRGLWEPVDGGWQIHDWDDYQAPSPSEMGRRSAEARRTKFGSADPRANRNVPVNVPVNRREHTETETETETETLAPAPAVAREPDLLFEAVCEVTDTDWHSLTESARKRLNRVVKELRQLSATPDDVRGRSRRYHERYPDATLTDTALSKWWATLGAPVYREPEEDPWQREQREAQEADERLHREDPEEWQRQQDANEEGRRRLAELLAGKMP